MLQSDRSKKGGGVTHARVTHTWEDKEISPLHCGCHGQAFPGFRIFMVSGKIKLKCSQVIREHPSAALMAEV